MEPPVEPDESECCNSGCNPCIFDVYEQQVKKYKQWLVDQQPIKRNCLRPLKYTEFALAKIIEHTKDTNVYIFQATTNDDNDAIVLYEPGQHLLLKTKSLCDDNDFTRAYTPIPWDLAQRQFAALIKTYPSGDMSARIRRWQLGDLCEWRGPYGDYKVDAQQKAVLMVAQGTGIAPIYAVIKSMLANDECDTRLKLAYCCTAQQVHLRDQLYALKSYWNFSYELYVSGEEEAKYNEVVHWRKLTGEDLLGMVEGCSSVLICGSQLFADSIKESVGNVEVHIF